MKLIGVSVMQELDVRDPVPADALEQRGGGLVQAWVQGLGPREYCVAAGRGPFAIAAKLYALDTAVTKTHAAQADWITGKFCL